MLDRKQLLGGQTARSTWGGNLAIALAACRIVCVMLLSRDTTTVDLLIAASNSDATRGYRPTSMHHH